MMDRALPALYFLVVLIACLLFARGSNYEVRLRGSILRFLDRIRLFRASERQLEVNTNIVRIAVGFLFLSRTLSIIQSVHLVPSAQHVYVIASIIAAMAVCITVGLFTPAVLVVALFLNNPLLDDLMNTRTLGTDVLHLMMLCLILVPAGRVLSVDWLLMNGDSAIARGLRGLYRLFGAGRPGQVRLSMFICVLGYGLLATYSTLLHLDNKVWRDGTVVGTLMMMNHQVFVAIMERYPDFFMLFSKISTYGMEIWELFFIPLVLFRFTRPFIVFWGIGFFLASRFILHLPSLIPEYQITMYCWLFWPTIKDVSSRYPVHVIYDDTCNLCYRTIRFLRFMDVRGRLYFDPVSLSGELLDGARISREAAMEDIHAITPDGKVYKGYDFYVLMTRLLFLLWPLYPAYVFGKIAGVGPRLYASIARTRRERFGVCTISPQSQVAELPSSVGNSIVSTGFLYAFIVAAFIYIVHFPGLANVTLVGTHILSSGQLLTAIYDRHYILPMARVVGLTPMDVFNDSDFNAARNTFMFYRLEKDNSTRPAASSQGIDISDLVAYNLVRNWEFARAADDSYCFGDSNDGLDRQLAGALSQYDESVNGVPASYIAISISRAALSNDLVELARRGRVKTIAQTKCATFINPKTLAVTRTDYYSGAYATRFPCFLEVQRIAYWYDAGGVEYDREKVLDGVRGLVRLQHHSPACYGDIQKALGTIDLDWRPSHLPRRSVNCKADLAVSEYYYRKLFDAEDKRRSASLIFQAERDVARNPRKCLLVTAQIRRLFLKSREVSLDR